MGLKAYLTEARLLPAQLRKFSVQEFELIPEEMQFFLHYHGSSSFRVFTSSLTAFSSLDVFIAVIYLKEYNT